MPNRVGCIAGLILAAATAAQAQQAKPHVTADLVADHTAAPAGGKVTLAVNLTIEKGWHLYWLNPGDTGVPPKIKWTLPNGVKAGPLRFPTPHRIDLGDLTAFGYQNNLTLLVDLDVPATAKGKLKIAGQANWVVCADSCVAERQSVELTLPVGAGEPNLADKFKAWQSQQPDRSATDPVTATIDADAKHGSLDVPLDAGESAVDFFPPPTPFAQYDRGQVVPIGQDGRKGMVYRVPFRVLSDPPADYSATGLIVVRHNGNPMSRERQFTFKFPGAKTN